MTMATKPGIYIHIPFCVRKCKYCAFLSMAASENTIDNYLRALERELSSYSDKMADREFGSIYFGGGTPSLLEPEKIAEILDCISKNFNITENAEITLEANPGTLGETEEDVCKKLQGYLKAGINRLSMGVQSMNDDRLKFLGRIHNAETVRRDYEIARKCGFDNISLDLITAVPGMSLDDALSDVRQIAELGPNHISMYTLQLEEGTPLYEDWARGDFELIDDELDRRMYHECSNLLEELGYHRYEISNFAKDGYEAVHNSKYWNMTEYLGVGLGASGFIDGIRYRNTDSMEEYLREEFVAERHENTTHDNISEAVFTGLRRREGIVFGDICEDFKGYYSDIWNDIIEYEQEGYLILDDNGMKLTDKGIDISNTIMALFV